MGAGVMFNCVLKDVGGQRLANLLPLVERIETPERFMDLLATHFKRLAISMQGA